MALYVIGDTHFSSDGSKSMEVFGGRWKNYTQRLCDSFSELTDEDTLVLCGDFSWAMSLQEALPDFKLLDSFRGRKILLKGNHDYWWETARKMTAFLQKNEIKTVSFLHNNFYEYGDYLICGTRGWMFEENDPKASDDKVFRREVMRLEFSLNAAKTAHPDREALVFLHYPPVFDCTEAKEFTEIMEKYGVKQCFYGHLHGESVRKAFTDTKNGIKFSIISADSVDFKPILLLK